MLHSIIAFILLQINLFGAPDTNYTTPADSSLKSVPTVKSLSLDTVTINGADTGYFKVYEIMIAGNRVTKDPVLLRELLFRRDDLLNRKDMKEILDKSRNNLFNTGLFHQVNVDYIILDKNRIKVVIYVNERWYFWPFPIIEIADRNLNVFLANKDFTRINAGVYLIRLNFRGRKESFAIRAKWGFTRQVGFVYNIPYLDKKQRFGLSVAAAYSRNRQIMLTTLNNKVRFFKDFKEFARDEWTSQIVYSYRQGYYTTQYLTLRYNNAYLADTIVKLNPDYFGKAHRHLQFFTLEYTVKYDKRDYRAYPLKGHYGEVSLTHHGFGLLRNEEIRMSYAQLTVKKFLPIKGRWFAAASAKTKLSLPGFQPYYVQRALGYNSDYVRGYEYYVIDGQYFALIRSNLKYQLVKPSKYQLPFLPDRNIGLIQYAFYINAFADAGKVWDNQFKDFNKLNNQLLYSYGLGLDFIGKNDFVMRLEAAINASREAGFYVHISAPI